MMKLYMMHVSPPSRAVLLTAKALGLELQCVQVNVFKKEHLEKKFLQLNSQHIIPTLDDNGTILWDSHAIAAYLVEKYGKNDLLYPKDLVKRAKIDQRLHFDTGMIFPHIRNTTRPVIKDGAKLVVSQHVKESLQEAYYHINRFLKGNSWISGDGPTIADFSLLASVTSTAVLVPIDTNKHSRVLAWIKQAEELPYYHEANQIGVDLFKKTVAQISK